ncbi:MAG: FtsQ-type POTRA domain-containing protein [Actinomycetota bacterium]|nr:FtsQ-type POTRA domain-containing protein [Actinomycetota bacterium]
MIPRFSFLARVGTDWLERLPALRDALSPREGLASLHVGAGSARFTLPSLRLPRRREVVATAALTCALAVAYVAAREMSLFAVETITVRGADSQVTRDVHGVLSRVDGTSLASVDADELERRLARLSSVRSAEVDRAFPHGLEVVVRPERGLAVVRAGGGAWVVGESGRVMEGADPRGRRKLPRIRVAAAGRVEGGEVAGDRRVRELLAVLRALPESFPVRVLSARAAAGQVTLVLGGWVELRLGDARAVDEKLRAAASVLKALSGEERRSLGYLDVTLPERPVAAGKNVPPPAPAVAAIPPAGESGRGKPSTRTSDLRVRPSQRQNDAVDSQNAPTYAPPSSSRG